MATKPLIQTSSLVEKFESISEVLNKFDKISREISIGDDETLAVAENNIAQIKELIKRTEALRKSLKEPHADAVKAIDTYARGIRDALESYSQRISVQVSTWKTVQAAAKRKELEAKEKELAIIEKEKDDEALYLARLTNTIYAKLFSGYFRTNKDEKWAEGCKTIEDCEQLEIALKKFPGEERFKHFAKQRTQILNQAIKAITMHKVDLMELESDEPGIQKDAQKRIKVNKERAAIIEDLVMENKLREENELTLQVEQHETIFEEAEAKSRREIVIDPISEEDLEEYI